MQQVPIVPAGPASTHKGTLRPFSRLCPLARYLFGSGEPPALAACRHIFSLSRARPHKRLAVAHCFHSPRAGEGENRGKEKQKRGGGRVAEGQRRH